MKFLRRITIFFVLLVVVGILGVVIKRQGQARELVLPDGSVVRYLGAVPGGVPFQTGKAWQRFLRQKLPAKFVRWVPPSGFISCGPANGVSCYFLRVPVPKSPPKEWRFWGRVEVLEEGGFVYDGSSGTCTMSNPGGSRVVSFSLRRFPRRQTQFPVRIYDQEGELLWEVMVKNPLKGPFPVWQGSPLPQTNVVGATKVVLREVRKNERDGHAYYTPDVVVSAEDGSASPFRMRYQQLSDATGNEGSRLSPKESVWKSTLTLYRPKDADFAEDAVGRFEFPDVPQAGELIETGPTLNIDGVQVRSLFMAGAGAVKLSASAGIRAEGLDRPAQSGHSISSSSSGTVETWESDDLFVVIETQDPGKDVEILFRVSNQDGNPIEVIDGLGGYSSGNAPPPFVRRYKLALERSPGLQSITIECIVNRGFSTEFMFPSKDVVSN